MKYIKNFFGALGCIVVNWAELIGGAILATIVAALFVVIFALAFIYMFVATPFFVFYEYFGPESAKGTTKEHNIFRKISAWLDANDKKITNKIDELKGNLEEDETVEGETEEGEIEE